MELDAPWRVRRPSVDSRSTTTPRQLRAWSAVRTRMSSTKRRYGLQVHRCSDGGAARSGGRGAHVASGRVCQRVNGRGWKGPLFRSGCRVAATHMSWAHVHAGSTPATRTISFVTAFTARQVGSGPRAVRICRSTYASATPECSFLHKWHAPRL